MFDIDNDGTIDLEEVMQLFYQRYGKEKLFKDANDAKATKQTAHDITFTEFVKHGPSPSGRPPSRSFVPPVCPSSRPNALPSRPSVHPEIFGSSTLPSVCRFEKRRT